VVPGAAAVVVVDENDDVVVVVNVVCSGIYGFSLYGGVASECL
jgi:hypothetical protein